VWTQSCAKVWPFLFQLFVFQFKTLAREISGKSLTGGNHTKDGEGPSLQELLA
jgi:hypothetical protein